MDSAVVDLSAAYALSIQNLNYDGIEGCNVLPPVWATTRAELWDTLDYFRTMRSNTYINGGSVFGFLVPADPGQMAYLDSELLITTIGLHTDEQGNPNQYTQYVLGAWRKTLENDGSVVVMMDTHCPLLEVGLHLHPNVRYVVLDHFRVRQIWCEMLSPGHPVWKIALQKYELFEESWWTPQQPEIPRDRDFSDNWTLTPGILDSEVCASCGIPSPRIYAQGWTCLDVHCHRLGDLDPSLDYSIYSIEYLRKRRDAMADHIQPYYLVPNRWIMLERMGEDNLLSLKLRDLYRGIVCDKCSKCVHRTAWTEWRCDHCGTMHVIGPGYIPLPATITRRTEVSFHGAPPFLATWPSDVEHRGPLFRPQYRMDKFVLAQGNQVTVLSPTEDFNLGPYGLPYGPDELFEDISHLADDGKLGLRRHPISRRNDGMGGMMNFFAGEWGSVGYAFHEFAPRDEHDISETGKATGTLPLENAVYEAGHLLNSIEEEEVGARRHVANSIQLVAYMEGMDLPWHIDSEGEVGEVISTLSLGGDATFLLRLQHAHRSHLDLIGDATDPMYRNSQSGTPLVLPLIHGSILIMQGSSFSNLYEYKIETHDRICFQVTNRTIDIDMRERMLMYSNDFVEKRPSGHLFLPDTALVKGVEEIRDNVSELESSTRYDLLLDPRSVTLPRDDGVDPRVLSRTRSRSPLRGASDRPAAGYRQRDGVGDRNGDSRMAEVLRGDARLMDLLRAEINDNGTARIPRQPEEVARDPEGDTAMADDDGDLGANAYQPAVPSPTRPDPQPTAEPRSRRKPGPMPKPKPQPLAQATEPPSGLRRTTRVSRPTARASGTSMLYPPTAARPTPDPDEVPDMPRSRFHLKWSEKTTKMLTDMYGAGASYTDISAALAALGDPNFHPNENECRQKIYRWKKGEAVKATRLAAAMAQSTMRKGVGPSKGPLEIDGQKVIWAWKSPEGDTYPPWIMGNINMATDGGRGATVPRGGTTSKPFGPMVGGVGAASANFAAGAKRGFQGAPLLPSTGVRGVLRGPPTGRSASPGGGPRTGVPMLPDTPGVLSPFGGQTHLPSEARRSPARVAFGMGTTSTAETNDEDETEAEAGAETSAEAETSKRKSKSPRKSPSKRATPSPEKMMTTREKAEAARGEGLRSLLHGSGEVVSKQAKAKAKVAKEKNGTMDEEGQEVEEGEQPKARKSRRNQKE